MNLITVSYKDLSGFTNDIELNISHIAMIHKETFVGNTKIKHHVLTLASGYRLEVINEELISKIKLIMKADKYKDGMIINTHQITIPFEEPNEVIHKPKPIGKKK